MCVSFFGIYVDLFPLGYFSASLSRLAEGRVDGLEDLELDAGLSLLLLRGGRADDLLGLVDAVADGVGGELVERVGLDSVDGEGVVGVDSGEAGGDWGQLGSLERSIGTAKGTSDSVTTSDET